MNIESLRFNPDKSDTSYLGNEIFTEMYNIVEQHTTGNSIFQYEDEQGEFNLNQCYDQLITSNKKPTYSLKNKIPKSFKTKEEQKLW